MQRRTFLALALGLCLNSFASTDAPKKRCPVCGMFIKDKAPTSFSTVKDKEPVHFCSFSCALAFHRKHPETALTTYDYASGAEIAADKAFFIIKSDKVAQEFKFAMAPVTVAFAEEAQAKKTVDKVKEGQVLKGFSAVKSALEK